jgi:azurin
MRWILGTALAATFAFSGSALAQDCAATVSANDQMQFVEKELRVSRSCTTFTVTLKHVGALAATVMGHNWVLTTTPDYMAVATAGMAAGAANNYVPAGDARVLAASKIIGGGEETTVSFDASKLEAGGDYTYFCSFPGHYVLMSGKLIVE